MISTEFYRGQGLGNQLWCYVTTRIIAIKHGYQFGIESPLEFKAREFMNIDLGNPVQGVTSHYVEQYLLHPFNGSDIRVRDEKLINVADNTKIDGCMQDEAYVREYKNEIQKWLTVKPEFECLDYASDDICVINFRGSGYYSDTDFFLHSSYWKHAIAHMRTINPHFKFVVITEDVKNAQKMFPDFEVHHFSIAKDYVVVKNAHYLILSNSSFAWFPAWLNQNLKHCIAPKYWARHNISDGYWSLGYNITPGWIYLDRAGKTYSYEQCVQEFAEYMKINERIMLVNSPFTNSCGTFIKNNAAIYRGLQQEIGVMRALNRCVWFNIRKLYFATKSKLFRLAVLLKIK